MDDSRRQPDAAVEAIGESRCTATQQVGAVLAVVDARLEESVHLVTLPTADKVPCRVPSRDPRATLDGSGWPKEKEGRPAPRRDAVASQRRRRS